MKLRSISGLLCAAVLFAGDLPVRAQDAGPNPTQGPGQPGKPEWGKKRGAPNITREEAQRLHQAREKAMEDPTVRSLHQAREALDKQLESAMDAAMTAADPAIGPVLEKVKQARGRAKDLRDRFQSLTPEQREALKAARDAAKDDPAVVAAREKMKAADGMEAKRAAGREMHEAIKAAIAKQNPALAPLLDQLGPPPGGPDGARGPGGPGGPGGRGGPGGPGGGPAGPPPPPPGEMPDAG
jgi:hypothetical protein